MILCLGPTPHAHSLRPWWPGVGGWGATGEGRSLSVPAPPHPPYAGVFLESGRVKTEL